VFDRVGPLSVGPFRDRVGRPVWNSVGDDELDACTTSAVLPELSPCCKLVVVVVFFFFFFSGEGFGFVGELSYTIAG
jgi:hypothetical protein